MDQQTAEYLDNALCHDVRLIIDQHLLNMYKRDHAVRYKFVMRELERITRRIRQSAGCGYIARPTLNVWVIYPEPQPPCYEHTRYRYMSVVYKSYREYQRWPRIPDYVFINHHVKLNYIHAYIGNGGKDPSIADLFAECKRSWEPDRYHPIPGWLIGLAAKLRRRQKIN